MVKLVLLNCRQRMTDEGKELARNLKRFNFTNGRIAEFLNCHTRTIIRALKEKPEKKQERKGAREKAQRQKLVKKLATSSEVNGRLFCPSVPFIVRELGLKHHIATSKATVRRDILELGGTARRRPKGPVRKRFEKRVKYAQTNLNSSKELYFSDEKYVDCNDHGSLWQWCFEGSRAAHREFDRWAAKLHVFGMIGKNFKFLKILPSDRLTSELYIQHCIKPNRAVLQGRNVQYIQDGAKAHTAKLTKKYLSDAGIDFVEDWPARSPDLNPIENLWAILAAKVSAMGPRREEDLQKFIIKAWNDISMQLVNTLVSSFQQRLREVIAAKGETIGNVGGRKRPRTE